MSTLPSFSVLAQLPAALFAVLVVVAMVGAFWLLQRSRHPAIAKEARPNSEPSAEGGASTHVVARVVAISEARIGRGPERGTTTGLLRRPGLGYHPQRLERRIAVLR